MEMNEKLLNLKQLVEHFKTNIRQYKSISYDEANTRVDFIDKFFELLDWDVRNIQEYSEDYREVVREDKVIIHGKPKAPDYSFRIGGTRKFFVEAKKPSVNIKEDIDPAYQIRRYAYTAKLPLSILTDFEEIAVYDTRIKPDKTDKTSVARIFYCTFEDYEKHFEFIYNTFSKNAILKGSFDRYTEDNKSKKGTSEVDKEFLKLISEWRQTLANNISIRNSNLDDIYQLNYAVQKIMDRIIFLRIAEDRGTEEYALLFEAVHRKNAYQELNKLFIKGNDKYNSDLFKLDDFLTTLNIDDNVLKTIITEMYYPDCPYEFSVLPIEVLGNIYEQFLGETIRLTPTHQVRIEKKPEVQKAGGVFYTPQYIVNYIVENTVGALICRFDSAQRPVETLAGPERSRRAEPMTPDEITKIKILDPACGSGSFLICAYTCLLNYHLSFYIEEKQMKKALKEGRIYQVDEKHFHLTIKEKQKILLNNIYGVDIDPQAVEVTKLSLLLKLMENEHMESAGFLFKHSDLKYLPNLSENIKCGNSLIGSDFYQSEDSLFDKETIRAINAFDWSGAAGFQEIMNAGGFDIVIGNPPYIQSRSELIEENQKQYIYSKYKTTEYQLNTYGLFVEKGVNLLKTNGNFGMIIPNYWLSTDYDKKLRKFIFIENEAIELLNVYKVFQSATVDTLLLFIKKNKVTNQSKTIIIKSIDRNFKTINERLEAVNQHNWSYITNYIIDNSAEDIKITFNKTIELDSNDMLGNYFIFKKGMQPYEEGKGNPVQTRKMMDYKIYDSKIKLDNTYEKLLRARNVKRYIYTWQDDWIKYGNNLAAPRDPEIFEGERIIIQRIISGININGAFINEPYICNTDVITLKPKENSSNITNILYFTGIILSKLCAFYIKSKNINLDRTAFPKVNVNTLETFPLPKLIINHEKEKHDKMVSLVEQMIIAQKELQTAKTEQDKALLKQQIEILDRKIDKLVYELYGLTDEEIKVVEGKE